MKSLLSKTALFILAIQAKIIAVNVEERFNLFNLAQ